MGCIYKITNLTNNKSYIGLTIRSPQMRWSEHVYRSKHITNESQTICKAIHKYGVNNFSFEVIEDNITDCDLQEREKYYISLFNTYHNGYNETPGGDGGCNLQTGISVCQWTLNGDFVKQWRTAQSVEDELGWAHEDLLRCCRGERISSHGYLWSFSPNEKPIKRLNKIHKPVCQLDDDLNIIQVFNTVKEAANAVSIADSNISRACRRHIRAGGYYWEYKKDL